MARFLCGLNREIQDQVELCHCIGLGEMVQTTMKVEQQLKRRGAGRLPFGGGLSKSWRPNFAKRVDNKSVYKPKSDTKLEAPKQVVKVMGKNYDDMSALVDPDDEDGLGAVVGELLVTRRILNTQHKEEEESQRENIFHTRCFVNGKVCSLIIDGGSCTNVASCELVKKLGLPLLKHHQPYRLQWFNDCVKVRVNRRVVVPFSIGKYVDEKCVFCTSELVFLGFVVSAQVVKVDEENVSSIWDWPTPTSIGQIRSFHGLASFYRRFVKDFSTLVAPMTAVIKKNVPFHWGEEQDKSFNILKQKLINDLLLVFPDFTNKFEIECDASGVGIRGVLTQGGRPVAVHSTTNYSPFEVVYDFNPLTPLDLMLLPMSERVNMDGKKKSEFVKSLHEKVRENIKKKNLQYTKQANKGRKKVVFEPGDWIWLHLRKEHFLEKRRSKLLPQGDGPFQVVERINDNAYKLDLSGECNKMKEI
ncbi:uncharacterized protein [Henckelia pumila]|uniref:uncharacterized protein n=1 Tax=Henckelia pumila TaxID=405737 RepID=UPI003C6E945A